MNEIFEKIKKGFSIAASETGKFTKSVVGKTGNLVDVTKLNLTLNDTERKIAAIQQKIGELVYEKYSEGSLSTSDFDELCGKIDEFRAEQENIKAQIAELKNATPCSVCGQNNEKENEFCAKCGTKLKKANDEDKVIEVTDFDEE